MPDPFDTYTAEINKAYLSGNATTFDQRQF